MRLLLAPVLMLALASMALGEVTIKGETKVAAHKQVRLKVDGDTKDAFVVWEYDEDKVDAAVETDSDLIFTAPPGTHWVRVRVFRIDKDGKKSSEKARVQVTIGDAPIPPIPPTDPFVQALQTAYASEADTQRATIKSNLAALYRQAAAPTFLASQATWGTLFDAMAAASKTLGVAGKLPAVQTAIGADLKVRLPVKRDQALDDAGRQQAAVTFSRVAAALEAVK